MLSYEKRIAKSDHLILCSVLYDHLFGPLVYKRCMKKLKKKSSAFNYLLFLNHSNYVHIAEKKVSQLKIFLYSVRTFNSYLHTCLIKKKSSKSVMDWLGWAGSFWHWLRFRKQICFINVSYFENQYMVRRRLFKILQDRFAFTCLSEANHQIKSAL